MANQINPNLIENKDTIIVDSLKLNVKSGIDESDDRGYVSSGEYTRSSDKETELSTITTYPKYSVSNYIDDRNNWRKQLDPLIGKGFFYFKIFFNFDTAYGLLGNIINNKSKDIIPGNTAYNYLKYCSNLNLYKSESLNNRIDALDKFVHLLGDISINTPWFFKEISGLSNIKAAVLNGEDFQQNSISITCSEESSDSRLGTLFDLYKYACYDNIRNKEIIPPNLRKFEMKIMFFHIPLRNYHTAISSYNVKEGTFVSNEESQFKDKSVDFVEKDNIMSFKMFTFQNCEFDVNSLNEFNDNLSNENIFDLGKNQIKINYDRVYENRYNEFKKLLISQDIFFDNSTDSIDSRLSTIADIINDGINKESASDGKLSYNLWNTFYKNTQNKVNLYGDASDIKGLNYASKIKELNTINLTNKLSKIYPNGNLYSNYTSILGQYFINKLKYFKEGTVVGGNIYNYDFTRIIDNGLRTNTQYLNNKLKRLTTKSPTGRIKGNLYGYKYLFDNITQNGANGISTVRVRTKYFDQKLDRLINGSVNGNIYGYDFFARERQITDGGQYGVAQNASVYDTNSVNKTGYTDYFVKKMTLLKSQTIKGNIYDYNLTRVGSLIESGSRENTKYLNTKLERLGTKKPTGTVSGNLYDYNFARVGSLVDLSKRENSPYLNYKLSRIGNLKSNEYRSGIIKGNLYDEDGYNIIDFEDINTLVAGSENPFDESIYPSFSIDSYLTEDNKNEFAESNTNLYSADTPWKFEVPYKDAYQKSTTITPEEAVGLDANNFSVGADTPIEGANPNTFKLSWNATAFRNSNNMYAVEGNPSTKKTWLGKIGESTLKRTISALGF